MGTAMPYLRQSSRHSKNKSSNVFTVAVLVGVIGFILTTSLPGSPDGGLGLIIGFLVSFPVLTTAYFWSAARNRRNSARASDQGIPSTPLPSKGAQSSKEVSNG